LRGEAAALRQQASDSGDELNTIQVELGIAKEETAALREEAVVLKHEVRTLKAEVQTLKAREGRALKATARRAIRAGQRSRRAARADAALLRHSVEVLSPAETAALVCVLREGQLDELARTLIHIYGRDNPDLHVMRAAAQLHRHGAPDDAAALLRAALSTRQGAP
jgi:chromosome segregation ATPase